MKEMKQEKDQDRRRFLIQTPIAMLGIFACMKGTAQASALQTGNYRRKIVSDTCVVCGDCVPECPTHAIQQSGGAYIINPNLCVGCGACQPVCPTEAIEQGTLIVVPSIDTDECTACGACAAACPTGAINVSNYAVINPSLCSGCRDCVPVCPVAAIS